MRSGGPSGNERLTATTYAGSAAYRLNGPPRLFMRALAPLVVAATAVVLGSGVALLANGEREDTWVGVHKASFVAWLALFSVHVLVYVWRLPSLVLDRRVPGFAIRLALVGVVLIAGLWIAAETALHDRWA